MARYAVVICGATVDSVTQIVQKMKKECPHRVLDSHYAGTSYRARILGVSLKEIENFFQRNDSGIQWGLAQCA